MTLAATDFAEFFAAVNGGHRPFAWQQRLLEHVVETGSWPTVIDAPTGTGKSSVIDVHLFAQALVADGVAGRLPRRLVVTVDRRALVDSHWEHASKLQDAVWSSADGVVAAVREALASFDPSGGEDNPPFLVSRVRGGEAVSRDWIRRPAACHVIAATPDMIGSRLLFRGYGSTRFGRPREAGLLAFDTVFVLDEAHLNKQLLKTIRRVHELVDPVTAVLGVPSLQAVAMTATPAPGEGTVIGVLPADLDGPDRDGPLPARLLSAKPVRIEPMPALAPGRLSGRQIGEAAEEIAEAVLTLLRNRRSVSADNAPATVGCIVNTVRLALAVAAQIRARGDEGDPVNVVTLVGRMRPHELHGLRAQHPDLFTLRGDKAVDVVVATQTLEVGVDMDFAALVTELAPGSALAQRAGRANRSGSRPDAPVIVFRPAEQPKDDVMVGPYSGDELAAAAAWLDRCSGSRLGLAPWRLHPRGEGLVPPGAADRRPVYQRVETWDVEDWERTSDDLAAEPWLDLWLADSLDPDLSVGFVVRAGLPRADLESARRQVEVTPPWVDEVFPATLTDAASILSSGRGPERVFLIRGDVVTTIDKESVGHLRLRPNDILVVDSLEGWTADGAITADSGARVDPEDVGELGAGSAKSRWARLGMETPLGRSLGAQATKDLLVAVRELLREDRPSEDTGEETIDPCEPIRELLESRPDLVDDPRVQLLSELLKWDPEIAHAADVGLGDDADSIEEYWIVVRGKDLRAIDEEALQTWVPQRRAVVDLDVHQRAVADEVAGLADRIGLSPVIRPALVHAARRHDQGKEDERFQRSLRWRPNHYEGRVLAKSGMQSRDAIREARAVSGLPRAWRHEQLSAAIAWAELASVDGATRDLATRLIGTSHGRGRHEFPHVGRTLVPQADAYAGVRELYDEGEWELVLARTSQRYGPWGCAYLEAVLRAADGEVSRRGS